MKKAITFGRYNILTNAHLSTIQSILEKYEYLELLILDPKLEKKDSPVDDLKEFYGLCDNNYAQTKNPVKLKDSIAIMKRTVKALGLEKRISIKISPRVEYNYNEFNLLYPSHEYDLVFPKVNQTESRFDNIRNSSFETILKRKVHTVEPKLVLHLSDIKREIKEGKDASLYFPIHVLEYLSQIDDQILT